jgi:hypothetical protein
MERHPVVPSAPHITTSGLVPGDEAESLSEEKGASLNHEET